MARASLKNICRLILIDLFANKRLKELGFKMLIPVHDEIIAECPETNAKECSALLAQTMSNAAEKILGMPIKCDVTVSKCWYGVELEFEDEEEEEE